ncbi:hypothetical protein ZWY2020_039778 [Hordeum vulgare]|nr:hypothetical protein ZWY2020_039778 [Hordeum vulgare]
MSSWSKEEMSFDDDCGIVNMDMGLVSKLVEDVSKMFDWQDGRVDKKVYQKQVEEGDFEKNKEESQAGTIKKTRKAMKAVEVNRKLLKKEKAKLEQVVPELLKDGHGSKEKLEKIKAILES